MKRKIILRLILRMKILLLLILFAAVFCIPAQTADIMPGAGYKISALQVEQQSGSDTLSGQMFQTGIIPEASIEFGKGDTCLLYTSPSPRDAHESRMPSSA